LPATSAGYTGIFADGSVQAINIPFTASIKNEIFDRSCKGFEANKSELSEITIDDNYFYLLFNCVIRSGKTSTSKCYLVVKWEKSSTIIEIDKDVLQTTITAAQNIVSGDSVYKENDRYNGKAYIGTNQGDTFHPIGSFYANFQTALATANTVNNTSNDQMEIDEASTALNAAIGDLIPATQVNATALYDHIQWYDWFVSEEENVPHGHPTQSAEGRKKVCLSWYTETSANAYRAALSAAKAELESLVDVNGNPTERNVSSRQSEIDTITQNLIAAYQGLSYGETTEPPSDDQPVTDVPGALGYINEMDLRNADYVFSYWLIRNVTVANYTATKGTDAGQGHYNRTYDIVLASNTPSNAQVNIFYEITGGGYGSILTSTATGNGATVGFNNYNNFYGDSGGERGLLFNLEEGFAEKTIYIYYSSPNAKGDSGPASALVYTTNAFRFTIAEPDASEDPDPEDVESIAVTKQPDKTQYATGETFSKYGMEVTATLKSGDTVPVVGYTVPTEPFTEVGRQTVTVAFGTHTAEVTVTVLLSISIDDLAVINGQRLDDYVLVSAGSLEKKPDTSIDSVILYGEEDGKFTFTVQEGVEVYIGDEKQEIDDARVCELSLPATVDGSVTVVRLQADGVSKEYKFTCYQQKYDGMPSEVVEYFVVASQYTNGNGLGPYGVNGAATLRGVNVMNETGGMDESPKSLGNFGGYIIYRYDTPITDDPTNPYGVDFIVYGNSFDGSNAFAEPGNVYVSEDGKTWYTLAGSLHYDDSAVWPYTMTYTKNSGGRSEWTDSSHDSGIGDIYPLKEYYPLFPWTPELEQSVTLSGVRLMSEYDLKGSGNSDPPYPHFGYADVGDEGESNEASNPYLGVTSRGGRTYTDRTDGFDLKWAVNSEGRPVDVTGKAFKYIKIQTASNVNSGGGGIGEKSTEIHMVRTAAPGSEDVGITGAPASITVDGKTVSGLADNGVIGDVSVSGAFMVKVALPETMKDANVYINGARGASATFAGMPSHEMLRIIVQHGNKEPWIVYLKLVEGEPDENSKSSEITFDTDGGAIDGETTRVYMPEMDEEDKIFPVPTRNKREFLGWYDAEGVEYEGYTEDMPEKLTLTARWKYILPSGAPDKVTATFRLIGATRTGAGGADLGDPNKLYNGSEYETWIGTRPYTLPSGSTVYDLFERALDDAGIAADGHKTNYVKKIQSPDKSYILGEVDNGQRSGWMYTINGSHPGYGLKEQDLTDGDAIVWHYVNDYAHEVEDWFENEEFPSEGDGTYYDKWLDAADKPYAELSRLALIGDGLAGFGFDAGSRVYPDVTVPYDTDAIAAIPQFADGLAVTVNGAATASGADKTVTLNEAGAATTITVVVTNENGESETYTITVNRAETPQTPTQPEAKLGGLTLDAGNLVFAEATTQYSVSVAHDVNSVTLTPTFANGLTVTVNDAVAASGAGKTVTLNAAGAATTITIIVTNADSESKTYTITVAGNEEPAPDTPYKTALDTVLAHILQTTPDPIVNSTGGEWAVMALARGGVRDNAFSENWLENLKATVLDDSIFSDVVIKGNKVTLHPQKYTENERVILALTSIGKDASNWNGWDFVSAMTDREQDGTLKSLWQGINSATFALIALDSGNYLPGNQAIRDEYINYLLANQHNGAGWYIASTPKADVTAMAVQALAPYYGKGNTGLDSAVDKALEYLSDRQGTLGDISDTSESTVQVIVALTALGLDPHTDTRFVKDGNSLIDGLLAYRVEGNGSFKHLLDGSGGNTVMSTEQAAYALVAYDRFLNRQNRLYDMTDAGVKSNDKGVKEVSVNYGVNQSAEAAPGTANNTFEVMIPHSMKLADVTLAMIKVTPSSLRASAAVQATKDGGKTWTFTVTAEDGTAQSYTLSISVDADPNAENAQVVTLVKQAIEAAMPWAVEMATANSDTEIKTWLNGELAKIDPAVTASITVNNVTSAKAGEPGGREAKAGKGGSFEVTVKISRGNDGAVDYAYDTVSIIGEITATPHISSDNTVKSVKVNDTTGIPAGTTFAVKLPYGTELSALAGVLLTIVPNEIDAVAGEPTTADGGSTWMFTVTAQNGAQETYTITVTIAVDTLDGNTTDVAAAKNVINDFNWTIPAEARANVQMWIQAQLDVLQSNGLNGVTVTAGTAVVTDAVDGSDIANLNGTPGNFTVEITLEKGADADTVAGDTITVNGVIPAIPYVPLTDTSVKSITAHGVEAVVSDGSVYAYSVTLPYTAQNITADDIIATPTDTKATAGTPVFEDSIWKITVTAESGDTATYTLTVTIPANPNEANAKLVAAAKAYLQDEAVFEVSMTTANTETAVQTWLTSRLAALPLAGVSAAINAVSVTPAVAGTEAEPDGTRGSFTAALTLSIGDGETAAEIVAEIGGAITATKYTPFTGGPRGDNITVTFRLVGASLSKADVDMKASLEQGGELWKGSEYQTWIATRSYTMREGDTNYDLFTQALRNAGLQSIGAEGNYVSTIYAPTYYGGHKLSEFTNGKYSGWMYTVNGKHPGYGLMEYPLSDGDIVIWHYVNDYRYEVGDWFNDLEYPALGDGGQWNKWLDRSVADTDPPRDGSVAPGVEQESEYETTAIDEPKTALGEFGGGSIVATETVTAEVKTENGRATAAIEAEIVTEAVTKAKETVEAAKADGAANAKAEVKIVAKADSSSGTVRSAEVDIPAEAIRAVADAQDLVLTIESDVSTITLDAATLTAIAETAKDGDTIKIAAESVDSAEALNDRQQARAGGNPVVELHISVGGAAITNLGGTVTVSLPYMPESDVAPDDYDLLTVYYLDDDGNITEMKGAKYDAATGSITFATTHFSKFFVTEWISPFGDITKGDWYYRAARYAYSNDLITGTTDTTFAPQTTLTRAMLITILARDAGIDTSGGETWYSKAVDWGMSNNLTDGTNINAPITREQFATLLYRYAQFTIQNSQFTIAADAADLSAYTDTADISDWAADAMAWAVANGLITGRTTTTLAPKGNTTRAETATLLQRYLENIA
jgi:hypothetical protein